MRRSKIRGFKQPRKREWNANCLQKNSLVGYCRYRGVWIAKLASTRVPGRQIGRLFNAILVGIQLEA